MIARVERIVQDTVCVYNEEDKLLLQVVGVIRYQTPFSIVVERDGKLIFYGYKGDFCNETILKRKKLSKAVLKEFSGFDSQQKARFQTEQNMKYTLRMVKNSPEIVELRREVERQVGRKMVTPTDFEFLADRILLDSQQYISMSTLKRLWGYVDGANKTRPITLNILSRYLGYPDFFAFVARLDATAAVQSNPILAETLNVSDLVVGDKVEIGWQPNRHCVLCYLGDDKFEVVDAQNSKLQVGNTFECRSFMLGQPLYLSRLVQGDREPVSFVVGKRDGLSLVNRLTK